jgi:CHAT domain-containing protein
MILRIFLLLSISYIYITASSLLPLKDYENCITLSKKEFMDYNKYSNCLAGLGLNYSKQKKYIQAEKYLRLSIDVIERKRENFKDGMLSYLISGKSEYEVLHYFEVNHGDISRLEIYKKYIYVLFKLKKNKLTLKFSEKIKGRILSDVMMSKIENYETINRENKLLNQEGFYLEKIYDINNQLDFIFLKNRGNKYKKKFKELRDYNKKLKKLSKKIQEVLPNYGYIKYPQNYISNTRVSKNEILIDFIVMEKLVLLFIITEKKFSVYPINIQKNKLKKMVDYYITKISTKPISKNMGLKKETIPIGNKLYNILLKNILEKKFKNKKKIIFVTDDFLSKVPFEALIVNHKNTTFLGDKYKVTYTQSISFYRIQKYIKAKNYQRRIFACLNPIFSNSTNTEKANNLGISSIIYKKSNLPQVPLTAEILNKIKIKKNDTIYKEDYCNKENILDYEISLNTFKYIIFGTHSIKKNSEPTLMLSSSVKEEHSYLTIFDILNLETNAELVMLLACGAENSNYNKGEGVIGLGKAFQYSGSKNVVTTLWTVPEYEGVEFTKVLLKKIIDENIPVSKALYDTKIFLKNEMGYSHPYYWASFVHLGL